MTYIKFGGNMFSNYKIILINIVVLSLMVITQCGKSTNPTSQVEVKLIGQWEWVESVRSSGIYVYSSLTPESEHKYKMYEFLTDSTYSVTEIKTDGFNSMRDEYTGNYSFTYESVNGTNDSVYVIKMDQLQTYVYELDGDSLFLSENCDICYKHTYVRID